MPPRIGFDTSPLERPHPPGVVRATSGLVTALERRGIVEVVRLAPAPGDDLRKWRQGALPARVRRDALAGLVPSSVLERREKVGFSVPLASFPVRSAAFRARLARVAGAKPGGPFRGSYLAGLGEQLERGVALRGVPLRVAWRAVGYDAWQRAFALEAHGLAPPS